MDQGDEGVPAATCGAATQAQDGTKNAMSWQRMLAGTDFRYTNFAAVARPDAARPAFATKNVMS